MFGFSMLAMTVATVTATTTFFRTFRRCLATLLGGLRRRDRCGCVPACVVRKEPPPHPYETFREALVSYRTAITDLVAAIADPLGDYGSINAQCKNNPPVDAQQVEVIVSGMNLNGLPAKQRAEKALADMTAQVDGVFEVPTLPEVKAVLIGLKSNLDEFGRIMDETALAGDLFKMSACDAGQYTVVEAATDLVTAGQFANRSALSLTTKLAATQPPCETTKVKDPYTDKAMRTAAGAKGTKTTSAGDMSMQYPTSLRAGKGIRLPINLDSKAPSGYVQVELTQGSKDLAALGGGTPAGKSGLLIKVFETPGRARPSCY